MALRDIPTSDLLRQRSTTAAKLRAEDAELSRRLRESLKVAIVPPLAKPLTGTARAAAAFIASSPASPGKVVAAAIDVSEESFRKHIWPLLRAHGFYSLRGCMGGYFPPLSRGQSGRPD